jgi:hypothetical protein
MEEEEELPEPKPDFCKKVKVMRIFYFTRVTIQ